MDADAVGDVVEDMRAESGQFDRRRFVPAGLLSRAVGYRGHEDQERPNCSASRPPIDDWLGEESVDVEMVEERGCARKLTRIGDGQERRHRYAPTWTSIEKVDPAPEPRPSLEGASGDARCVASGHPLCAPMHRKTPINEYKQEAFALFERMLSSIREDVTRTLAHAEFPVPGQRPNCLTCPTSSPSISIRSPARTTRAISTAGRIGHGDDDNADVVLCAARKSPIWAPIPRVGRAR